MWSERAPVHDSCKGRKREAPFNRSRDFTTSYPLILKDPHQEDLAEIALNTQARDPHQVDLWAAPSYTSGPLGRFDEAIHIASTKAAPRRQGDPHRIDEGYAQSAEPEGRRRH